VEFVQKSLRETVDNILAVALKHVEEEKSPTIPVAALAS
jgi:hypothetical protein